MQQIIAIIIIALMLGRLFWQRKRKEVAPNEFLFWLAFWLLAGAAIAFIKQIDALAARLGFSGAGIDLLFYLAVIFLFYLAGKARIRQERTEKSITRIISHIGLADAGIKKDEE